MMRKKGGEWEEELDEENIQTCILRMLSVITFQIFFHGTYRDRQHAKKVWETRLGWPGWGMLAR